jgi:predicted nucleotidyltransferase component of viral defense system
VDTKTIFIFALCFYSTEKDWWVTAVLYALFHTSVSEYLLFKGGTSLSKGWDIINRFSEDIDLALSRDYFLNVKQLSCASCTSNTQIHTGSPLMA